MAPRFLTIMTGRNLPKIRQSREGWAVDHQRKDDREFHAGGSLRYSDLQLGGGGRPRLLVDGLDRLGTLSL
jgi:hypothetical protein